MRNVLLCLFMVMHVVVQAQTYLATNQRLDSLQQLVVQSVLRERTAEAEKQYALLMPIAEENKDAYPINYARAKEAEMFFLRKNPKRLMQVFSEVKTYRISKLGRNHVDYARSLNSEAMLMRNIGKANEAIPLIDTALQLAARDSGQNSLFYASICANYATILHVSGHYSEALNRCIEALDIRKGIDYPSKIRDTIGYTASLLDAGGIYNNLGRLEEMEDALIECRNLRKIAIGPNSSAYRDAMTNLASYYAGTGQKLCAIEIYLDLQKSYLDEFSTKGTLDSLGYGVVLGNFALAQSDNLIVAESLFRDAIAVKSKVPGKNHPYYHSTALNLGGLYFKTKRYALADSLWHETESWARRTKNYATLAPLLKNMGDLFVAQNKPDSAQLYYAEALSINRDILGVRADHPYVLKCLRALATLNSGTPIAEKYITEVDTLMIKYLLTQAKFSSEIEMQRMMGSLLPDFEELYGIMFAENTPAMRSEAYNLALVLKENLAQNAATLNKKAGQSSSKEVKIWKEKRRALSNLSNKPQGGAKEEQKILRDSITQLEKTLGKLIEQPVPTNWKEVRDHLNPGEAAVEYVIYRPLTKTGENPLPIQYAALILRPEFDSPRFVPLCKEQDLEKLWNTYNHNRSPSTFDNLYSYKRLDGIPSLYKLILEPLEPFIKTDSVIYYSPTGYINLFNPRAAQKPNGKLPNWRFNTFSSTGHLVESTNYLKPDFALLMGEANTDANSTWIEATKLAKLFTEKGIPMDLKTGLANTETSFFETCNRLSGFSNIAIHMALHGHFVEKPITNGCSNLLNEDPMFQAWVEVDTTQKRANTDDGRITAYDISTLDFSNVGLVYLSSCETGIGNVRGFEGIFGLQRAFKIAGAQKIVVCLNGIPTIIAQEMTTQFYEKWLNGKTKTVRDAFYEAQLERRKGNAEAHNWASFMLIE